VNGEHVRERSQQEPVCVQIRRHREEVLGIGGRVEDNDVVVLAGRVQASLEEASEVNEF
jgi:hypothetical protein